jgi:hypothetical protein
VLLDLVPLADCSVADDQRLFPRPQAAGCEVGAVEVSPPVTLAATKTPFDASVPVGHETTFKMTVKNTGTGTPQPGVLVEDPNCGPPALFEGDANSNGTLDPGETWVYACIVTPTTIGTFTNTIIFTVTDTDGLPVSAQATASVPVVGDVAGPAIGPAELARTGRRTGDLARLGTALIGLGTVLVLRRPYGKHYHKRFRR